jgi:hypothetical protein
VRRQIVLSHAFHKDRENAGRLLNRERAAAIGRTEAVAKHQLHAEAGRAGLCLAEPLLPDPDLKPGQICELLRKPRLAVRVGDRFLAPELIVDLALVIATQQKKMNMGEWLAILAAENANGDGSVVCHGIESFSAAEGSGQQSQSGGNRKWKKSDHALRLTKHIGATGSFNDF